MLSTFTPWSRWIVVFVNLSLADFGGETIDGSRFISKCARARKQFLTSRTLRVGKPSPGATLCYPGTVNGPNLDIRPAFRKCAEGRRILPFPGRHVNEALLPVEEEPSTVGAAWASRDGRQCIRSACRRKKLRDTMVTEGAFVRPR